MDRDHHRVLRPVLRHGLPFVLDAHAHATGRADSAEIPIDAAGYCARELVLGLTRPERHPRVGAFT